MGLFSKMKEPVFLKESSNLRTQLEKLKEIQPLLNETGQAVIRQDMKYLEYGITGEESIAFELKNSHMPMYILHDIYLEKDGLSAQIDYLVFTKKICFVIECKNLYGNIEINNSGDFIRTVYFGGKALKEGIYSPITQNQRHLELMKKIKVDKRENVFTKYMAGKYFENFHKSVVVLANPKTVLNAKFAKKEVKGQVIRADQLVKYIKDTYNNSKEMANSEKDMLTWAQSYLNIDADKDIDYTDKYEKYYIQDNKCAAQKNPDEMPEEEVREKMPEPNIEDTEIFKDLKEYRLCKSREDKIKPYFIFNDRQLKEIIFKMPQSEEELKAISGFGEVKAEKYGKAIFEIIEKYL